MLELRPNCEHCNTALPPDSEAAMICSFECTFCRDCVERLLLNVCPNCGGGLCPRPIRPHRDHKGGNYLGAYPAGSAAKHRPVDLDAHRQWAAALAVTPPARR